MAITRHATGSSRPRTFDLISTDPVNKRRAAKTTTTRTKKPTTNAAKVTGSGRVTKRAPAAHHRRKPKLGDKIAGAAKKIVGAVEGRPGKKAAGTAKMRGHDGKNNRTARGRKGKVAV